MERPAPIRSPWVTLPDEDNGNIGMTTFTIVHVVLSLEHYKQRLLDLEKTLSARIGHEADQGRGEFVDAAHDVGDASVADEVASEEFTVAEHNSAVLQQVREALGRVADGTFGRCIVDGGPVEERRLEAV